MMDYFLASLNSMNPLFRKKHISFIIFWICIYHCSAQESQTRKGFINVQHPELMAIANGGDPENKYAPIQPKSEVGIFSYIEIEDEYGIKFQYMPGDFIVVGGNGLKYFRR